MAAHAAAPPRLLGGLLLAVALVALTVLGGRAAGLGQGALAVLITRGGAG